MTFQIDTGMPEHTIRSVLPDWFLDQYEDTTSDAALAHDYGYHMIAKSRQPARLETVRRHFKMSWQALQYIAELQPEVFDEVLCAYAEKALLFEQPNAA